MHAYPDTHGVFRGGPVGHGRDMTDDIYAPFVYTEKAPMSTCNHLLARDVARAYEKFKY